MKKRRTHREYFDHFDWRSSLSELVRRVWGFAQQPGRTNGGASVPGPRLRRGGPRSAEAQRKRVEASHRRGGARDGHWVGLNDESMAIMHVNVRDWRSNKAELAAVVRAMAQVPDIICLIDAFLDASVGGILFEGHVVAARPDRRGDRIGEE